MLELAILVRRNDGHQSMPRQFKKLDLMASRPLEQGQMRVRLSESIAWRL